MSKFEMPDFYHAPGALTYIQGPDGQPLGRGYHHYEVFSPGDDSEEARVLVGVVGAVKHILAKDTFAPLVFGSEPMERGGFWEYTVRDGMLYGYTQDPADAANLGSWPPEGAYDGKQ